MASSKGGAGVDAFFAATPEKLKRLLGAAGRVGGKVIAADAKARVKAEIVRENVRVRTKASADHVVTIVDVKPGWGRSVGTWLEDGTSAHFISVSDENREGRTVRRINIQAKENGDHSLVIGGAFVGRTVLHPGAQPVAWLRPALLAKEKEAMAAAQSFISARVGRRGVKDVADEGDDK